MRKIVLAAINAKYSHTSLAAWVLAEAVSMYSDYKAIVAETNINQKIGEIADAISVHNPHVIGIGVYIWNAKILPEVIKTLRARLPCAVFILGGPEASFNSGFWLKNGADYVICGEGEQSLPALLSALGNKQGDNAAREKVIQGAPPTAYVDPYRGGYLETLNGRIAYIETSRGCPYSCKFCLSGKGKEVRFFPMDEVKRRIRKLSETTARTIKFVDRTFNCNASRAYEIFEYVIGLPTTRCFHFEVAPDLFEQKTLELLKTAPTGRIQLEAGLQSFHKPALEAVSRKTDIDKACENIRKLVEMGNIHLHVDLIAGLPYENLQTFIDGFDRVSLLAPRTSQLGFLKLLHGSGLREEYGEVIKAGNEPPYEFTESPWLSAEDIRVLKHAENAQQHTYNKARFLSALRYALSVTHMRPFALYHAIGKSVPGGGKPLGQYAEEIYNFLASLPGVNAKELLAQMIRDWLSMVKGNDMPKFMKIHNKELKRQTMDIAQKTLGRTIRRNEAAILPTEPQSGIYVDSMCRNPVTGLYKTHTTASFQS